MNNPRIVVLGAGPAGCTIALQLAQLGHEVQLLGRAACPRPRIGATLPHSILPLLNTLGVAEAFAQADFMPNNDTVVQWGTTPMPEGMPIGFSIDRARFEQLLLNAAQQAGVIIKLGQLWLSAQTTERGWCIPSKTGDVVRADFLVDATGKQGTVLRGQQACGVSTTALYAHWHATPWHDSVTRVEAGENHWCWGTILPTQVFCAGVFFDTDFCRGLGRSGLQAAYLQALAQSMWLSPCLQGKLVGHVQSCDASAYIAQHLITSNYLKVGDAAFSLDPLSSQGIQAAMRNAVQAAIVLNTLIRHPADSAAALQFYQQRIHDTVHHHQAWARSFYAQSRYHSLPFWQRRAQLPLRMNLVTPAMSENPSPLNDALQLRLHPQLRYQPQAVMEGDFIRFSEAVQHPALSQPLVYLGHYAVPPLLKQVQTGQTAAQVVQQWQKWMPALTAWQMLDWLWQRQLLIACEG